MVTRAQKNTYQLGKQPFQEPKTWKTLVPSSWPQRVYTREILDLKRKSIIQKKVIILLVT
jgi:hypothetical protein